MSLSPFLCNVTSARGDGGATTDRDGSLAKKASHTSLEAHKAS